MLKVGDTVITTEAVGGLDRMPPGTIGVVQDAPLIGGYTVAFGRTVVRGVAEHSVERCGPASPWGPTAGW